jgi:methylated-DNA-protein-cysteine methyltransferase related protein
MLSKNHQKKAENDNFFEKVYQVTRLVPQGRVTTYGSIARYIGAPGASRMVGWALNNSHTYNEFIPAHRVVNRNGMLTGKHHFRHPELMQQLLEAEGIMVENDRILDFENKYWDPYCNLI